MTVDEFRAALRQLGLRQSNVGTVYLDANGTPYHVQDPGPLPADVRAELIRRLRALMGVREADR